MGIYMKTVKLSERLPLSAVVQGFWRLEDWKWTSKELAQFMNACIDRGITSFDTAEIYSSTLCEKLMGDAFSEDASIRGRIQLISKTGINQKKVNGETFGYYNTSLFY